MTFIKCPSANWTNPAIPTLSQDSMLNEGSLFLVDFKKQISFPLQGDPPAGTPVLNIVEGQADGTVFGSGVTFENGSLVFHGNSEGVAFGSTNSPNFNFAAGNIDFMLIAWIKIKTEYAKDDYANIFGRYSNSSAVGAFQYTIESGVAGLRPRASFSTDAAVALLGGTGNISQDVVVQVGAAYVGNNVYKFINGAEFSTAALTRTGALGNPSTGAASYLRIGGGIEMNFYRAYIENLTVSGASVASRMLADYNANVGRFS